MKAVVALAAAALLTGPVFAAPCRGTGGKFVKCPPASGAATASAGITKDAKGKCHAPGGKFVACPK